MSAPSSTSRNTPRTSPRTSPGTSPRTGPPGGARAGSSDSAPCGCSAETAPGTPPAPAADASGPPSGRAPAPGSPRARLTRAVAPLTRLPRWTVLPACALLGALAGGAYGMGQTPVYTATSHVVAVPRAKADPATALGFAQAYGKVATQLAVLGDAQVAAGVSPAELQDKVKVATSPDAPMISVSASAARPDTAAALANAVSRSLTTSANHTRKNTQVELLPFSRAVKPTAPSSLSTPVSALVGLCAGGLLGGLVLLVRPRATGRPSPGAAVPGPASAETRGSA